MERHVESHRLAAIILGSSYKIGVSRVLCRPPRNTANGWFFTQNTSGCMATFLLGPGSFCRPSARELFFRRFSLIRMFVRRPVASGKGVAGDEARGGLAACLLMWASQLNAPGCRRLCDQHEEHDQHQNARKQRRIRRRGMSRRLSRR